MIGEQWGLRYNYAIAACLYAASTALIVLIHPQPVAASSRNGSGIALLQDSRYLVYLAALFVAAFALFLPQPLSPNILQNERGLDLAQIGRLYALSAAGVVVLNLFLGRAPARIGFMLGQAAVLLFALLVWRGTHVFWYGIGYFLLGGYKTARSLGYAQVREFIGSDKMGMAYGLAETVSSLGVFVAPLIASWLYVQNPTWMYAVSIVLIFVSLVVSALFSPVAKAAARPAAEYVE